MQDTDPNAERVQLELFRRASVSQRISLALSLSETTMRLAHRAIRDAHAGENEIELAAHIVGHCYGATLEAQFRAYLKSRNVRLPNA